MKTYLVQSNYWHNPGIKITLHQDDLAPEGAIHVEVDFEDVIKAILVEISHPFKIWTRASQEKALREAITKVLDKSKHATSQVM